MLLRLSDLSAWSAEFCLKLIFFFSFLSFFPFRCQWYCLAFDLLPSLKQIVISGMNASFCLLKPHPLVTELRGANTDQGLWRNWVSNSPLLAEGWWVSWFGWTDISFFQILLDVHVQLTFLCQCQRYIGIRIPSASAWGGVGWCLREEECPSVRSIFCFPFLCLFLSRNYHLLHYNHIP